jgi:eukaryotic-like serine/threonine-protein kinase
VLKRPLGERAAGAVARLLAERGERSRALQVLAPTMAPDNLMLLAELAAEERDFPRATAALERVLAHDIATPGAVERHAHFRSMLGASVQRPVRRRDEATVATVNPEATSYRILREVGRGGAGTVYEAVDESLGRRLAFKVFHRRGADADALLRESRLASMLGPRFAVRVFDADPAEGWVAMEWATGGSLRDVFARSSTPPSGWVLPLAEALASLHATGVVHGDLKPGNVLLRSDDAPILADFGVARRPGEDPGGGSAAYLSPERLGGALTSFGDDVYAFGRVLEDARRAAERTGGGEVAWLPRGEVVMRRCLGPAAERPSDGTKLIELLRGS